MNGKIKLFFCYLVIKSCILPIIDTLSFLFYRNLNDNQIENIQFNTFDHLTSVEKM